MKVAAFAGVLALALIGAGSALAQSWVDVGSDVVKTQYQVDSLSVKIHGRYVESWQRQLYAKPVKLPSGKYYTISVSHRREDCAAGESAGLDATFTDAKGAVVETYSIAESRISFHALVPGSIGRTIHDQVCDFAKRIVTLKPTVPTASLQDTDWVSLGSDAENRSDVSLATSSVQRAGERVVLIVRSHNHAPIISANKFAYRTQYATWQLDCSTSVFRVSAIDYYDDNGQLVDTSPADLKTLEFVPINPNSQAGMVKNIACSTPAAPAVAQNTEKEEPQGPSSGTGWLGPKGYIITASHVVGAATVVGVAQDGKIVGTAEVVVSDPANDVAILKPKFESGVHPVIQLAADPAALGQHVFTLGYPAPDNLGLSVKMTSGEVSSLAGSDGNAFGSDVRLLQTSTPIQPGNSGGPLLDDRGQAVGVVVIRVNSLGDTPAQNVNYAVKIAYVRGLLSELPDLGGYRPLKVSASIPNLVADLRESVFMLVVLPEKE